MLKKIKKSIDSWNINFLLGSWLSRPLLDTLNWIENNLTDAEKVWNTTEVSRLKKEYFEKCMKWNITIFDDRSWNETLENYKNFYKVINQILLERDNSLLTKQVNIFTTNIDILSELALEETWLEFNDWFHGRFNPKYEVWNFKKSVFMKSLHYENTSEIPNFNILKLHGSLSWNEENRKILLDKNLKLVRKLEESFDEEKFDELMIINPKKTKFEDTIFNQYSYDLLRMYSNELEKENSVLFVMWFSFADEHIRDLTLRVANSNPTLKIYIFSFSQRQNKSNLKYLREITQDIKIEKNNFIINWIDKDDDLKKYIEKFKGVEWDEKLDEKTYSNIEENIINNTKFTFEIKIKELFNYIKYRIIYEDLEYEAKNKNIKILYPEWDIKNYDFKTIIDSIFLKLPWLKNKLLKLSFNIDEKDIKEDYNLNDWNNE